MDYENTIKLNFVENDTLPEIYCHYKNKDLTGYQIELHINYSPNPLIKQAIPLDMEDGKFKFKFEDNELQRGYYDGEIQFINPFNEIYTVKNLIFDIKEEIA